ncbi:MAG: ComEA family DNA-binding protein [Anaerolineae bacterium]|nr:ComEA family DNA-binding protein [Anaerolineae bacterium]
MGGNPFTARAVAKTPDEIRREVQQQLRWYLVVAVVISAVIGGVIGKFGFGQQVPGTPVIMPSSWDGIAYTPPVSESATVVIPTVTPEPLPVYVTGAVVNPGLVVLPAGSLAVAAVEAAGGPTEDADLEALNLAAPLQANQQLIVPRQKAEDGPAEATPAAVSVININTATAAELESLPHIGPTRAQQIVAFREEHGPFARKDDLQDVPGIGPATFADLEPYITVEP